MKKAILLCLAAVAMCVCITACGASKAESKTLTWAQPDNYMFAVDVSGYTGDSVPAGMYKFTATAKENTVPVVYDIYVSKTEHTSFDELADTEYRGNVGGTGEGELDLKLFSGDYAYVRYNEVAGEQGSSITISPMK